MQPNLCFNLWKLWLPLHHRQSLLASRQRLVKRQFSFVTLFSVLPYIPYLSMGEHNVKEGCLICRRERLWSRWHLLVGYHRWCLQHANGRQTPGSELEGPSHLSCILAASRRPSRSLSFRSGLYKLWRERERMGAREREKERHRERDSSRYFGILNLIGCLKRHLNSFNLSEIKYT